MDGATLLHVKNDYEGLNAAANAYITALNDGDLDALREMFLPESHLYAAHDYRATDGSRMILPRDQWLELVKSRGAPREKGFQPDGRVVMVDFLDPNTAMTKIEVKVGDVQFTDYLNYLRIDGAWKVVAKVFYRHG